MRKDTTSFSIYSIYGRPVTSISLFDNYSLIQWPHIIYLYFNPPHTKWPLLVNDLALQEKHARFQFPVDPLTKNYTYGLDKP